MRKKYLSALLFGALLFASAGTFTSCKDYDDDINNLQEQIDKVAADLSDLAELVKNSGKGVTSVTFDEETGVLTVVTDGQTATYTVKTSATGSVNVEIKNGHLFVDGVDKGEVSGSKVTVVDGVLNIDGEPAGLEVGSKVVIAKGNGVYQLTVDGETIELPMAAASISYIDVINGDKQMNALYDINKTDVEYGPEGNKKTLKAGLYTTLDRDLKIVVNPKSADASIFTFSLKNSENVDTELKFKPAKEYKGVLFANETRATSANSIWVLENDYTRYDNVNLDDIRTNLYLKFKANDGPAYALTLEAANDAVTINTPYNLGAELRQMKSGVVGAFGGQYKYINEWNVPENWVVNDGDESAVYDYWLTLEQSPLNLQQAKMYGVEISEDGHSFRFTKEAGIGNSIKFVYNYILVNGTVYQGQTGDNQGAIFTASFSQETAEIASKVFEDLIKPFDAEKITKPEQLLTPCNSTWKCATAFAMTQKYDYASFYDGLSDDQKLVWNSAVSEGYLYFDLIGGEGDNNAEGDNWSLLNNIRYSIDNTKKEITLQFLVDENAFDNFTLNNAYALEVFAKDPIANNIVASLKFPFELQQPTMDIVTRDGNFSEWTTEGDNNEEVLLSYGAYKNNTMYLPLFESFKAWTKDYTDYDANAQYYTLMNPGFDESTLFLGKQCGEFVSLDNNLQYTSVWQDWNTFAEANMMKDQKGNEVEKSIMVQSAYKHYGVYPEDLFTNGTKNQFKLVFASLLNHSTLKMAEGSETLTAAAGTNVVFISNKDLNFLTPKDGKFFLFDGLNANGEVVTRAELNELSFNEAQRPFASEGMITWSAKDKKGDTEHNTNFSFETFTDAMWVISQQTGDRTFNLGNPDATKFKFYNIPAFPVVKDNDHTWTSADVVKGHEGGIAIQLPTSIEDQQEIEFTLTVKDALGFTNNVKFVVKKIK